MKMHSRPSPRRGRDHTRRRWARLAAIAAVGAITAWSSAGVAGAAVTNFTVSPPSAAPGTVIHVSGTGCSPGLLSSPGTDFVEVTSPTLAVALQVPVSSNGAWQGSFTVPPSALAGVPGPVAALCVSGGLQSLLTIYLPQTFTVTGGGASTTTAPAQTNPEQTPILTVPSLTLPGLTLPGVTLPGVTRPGVTTTRPPDGSSGDPVPTTSPRGRSRTPGTSGSSPPTNGPGSTVEVPGDAVGSIGGGNGAGVTVTIGSADVAREVAAAGKGHKSAAGPATLEPADLGAALVSRSHPDGLGWLGWLLLVALAVGLVGMPAWLWRSRRRAHLESPGEVS